MVKEKPDQVNTYFARFIDQVKKKTSLTHVDTDGETKKTNDKVVKIATDKLISFEF